MSLRVFTIAALFMFVGTAVFAQQKRNYVLVYKKKANLDSLHTQFRAQKSSASERALLTLELLHRVSAESGQQTETFLGSFSTQQVSYRKHWISNALSIQAEPALITQLSQFEEVAYIDDVTDLKIQLMEPVKMVEDNAGRAIGSAEPGLVAVGARELWNLGYTGKGLKLLSFDTGIWPTHPALGGRFYGEYVPYDLAWNGIWEPTPADKANSHGTHTVGTMAGLDTLTNDTIGLAFGAYIMATDPIVSNLADTIGVTNLMLAYEWALNPDGDISTTGDMPDVICNSWGTAGNAGFCGSYVADMLIAIDLAGIGNEYSAGNNGPNFGTVGLPALMNPGILNAFAVGAVSTSNVPIVMPPNYQIASFSSRGPTPCLGGGSIEIKPEVVAPGVNVRSAVKTDAYAFYDGTSMAGPHVAGILLLLKEAFPSLPGETLKEAIYYSAYDMGDVGEDNTFGMGMVNAFAAYNWLINEGYTPQSPQSLVPELMLEKWETGLITRECSSPFTPQINLYNEGNLPIQDTVYFSLNLNGNVIGNWAQFINLPAQQRLQVSSPFSVNPAEGTNELWISARQKSTPIEKDNINNNRNYRFEYNTAKTVPYLETFESNSFADMGWEVMNPDKSKTFELFATGGQPNGLKSAAMRFYVYVPAAGQQDLLISPPIKLETGNHFVAFDISYQQKAAAQNDSILLLASLDCGKSFTEVIFEGGPAQMATYFSNTPSNFTPSLAEQWKRVNFPLSPSWNGETLLFAFKSVNSRGANAYLDNFAVFTDTNDPMSLDENTATGFSVFPNPFVNELNIQFTAPTSGSLSLTDLSGRQIKQVQLNGETAMILNTGEELAKGIYFISLWDGKSTSVLKLVKQ